VLNLILDAVMTLKRYFGLVSAFKTLTNPIFKLLKIKYTLNTLSILVLARCIEKVSLGNLFLMFEFIINFDENLSFEIGFSYHSVIYIGSVLFFIITLIVRTIRDRKYHHLTSKIKLHKTLTILLCSFTIQRLVIIAAIVLREVWPDIVNVPYLFSDIIFLWNITFSYTVIMAVGNGWCVSKLSLSPNEKQKVVLVSAAMMLCEVLLISDFSLISLVVSMGYVACYKIFLDHISVVKVHLKGQMLLLEGVIMISHLG
jgi:hypothetical protein